jgi:hypothetical protein
MVCDTGLNLMELKRVQSGSQYKDSDVPDKRRKKKMKRVHSDSHYKDSNVPGKRQKRNSWVLNSSV